MSWKSIATAAEMPTVWVRLRLRLRVRVRVRVRLRLRLRVRVRVRLRPRLRLRLRLRLRVNHTWEFEGGSRTPECVEQEGSGIMRTNIQL